uniref:Uncharacterized protein n=1 Tax=Anguilla anguilla TaxID=7936 RepID=A0A0E9PIT8_ANGAN
MAQKSFIHIKLVKPQLTLNDHFIELQILSHM